MAYKQVYFSARLSEQMLKGLDKVSAQIDNSTRAEVASYLVQKYLQHPVFYESRSILALRMPLMPPLAFQISEHSLDRLKEIAQQHNSSVAAIVRIAIYEGLMAHETS